MTFATRTHPPRRRARRRGVAAGLAALALCLPTPAAAGSSPTRPIVFVSDTQSPIWVETLVLRPFHNRAARAWIFEEILAVRPEAVIHAGDLVNLGWHGRAWEDFDRFHARLAGRGVPLYPVLGNHEGMIFQGAGERAFQERFPFHRKTGYARVVEGVGVVLLNSNLWGVSIEERWTQLAFLDSVLAAMDADTAVRAVVVVCHHSPYTNSMVVFPSIHSRVDFVPGYLGSRKAVLFVSGHAHAFEHFREDGKDFLVIGGGGGLQQPLLTGVMRRWEDHFPRPTTRRMFHYLRVTLAGDTLVAVVRMLREDFTAFEDAYTVRAAVPRPKRRLPAAVVPVRQAPGAAAAKRPAGRHGS